MKARNVFQYKRIGWHWAFLLGLCVAVSNAAAAETNAPPAVVTNAAPAAATNAAPAADQRRTGSRDQRRSRDERRTGSRCRCPEAG